MLRLCEPDGGRRRFTFPIGRMAPGDEPDIAAAKALQEQTGFACRELVALGSFVVDPACGGGVGHYFYGCDALRATQPAVGDERAIQLARRPFDELPACVGFDGYDLLSHAAAIGLAHIHRARLRARP